MYTGHTAPAVLCFAIPKACPTNNIQQGLTCSRVRAVSSISSVSLSTSLDASHSRTHPAAACAADSLGPNSPSLAVASNSCSRSSLSLLLHSITRAASQQHLLTWVASPEQQQGGTCSRGRGFVGSARAVSQERVQGCPPHTIPYYSQSAVDDA